MRTTIAQTASTGALTGTVTDPQGGVVPGVAVSVTSQATGQVRTTMTHENGNYLVPLLLPGSYRVELTKNSFKVAVETGIHINVTETARLDVKLELGETQEKITVSVQAQQLETTSSALGKVTSSEVVSALPLVNRNFTQIIALSPGVAADVTQSSELGRGSGGVSNGTSAPVSQGGTQADNNFQMDGVGANDLQNSGALSGGVAIPNPDAIEEFKVQTGLYDAGYGGHAGANVNLVTKGGSNQFHGSVFEYFRNDVLNANDFFRNSNKQPRQVLKQNQFGFAAGGPVVKDKLFFFGSYQGTRQRNGVDSSCSSNFKSPALTDAMRGSKATLGAFFVGQTGALGPGTGGANTIKVDGSNISDQAFALLNLKVNGKFLIPTPQTVNKALPSDAQGSTSFSVPCPFTENQFVANMDIQHTQKSKFSGRFFSANSTSTTTIPFGGLAGGAVPGFPHPLIVNFRNFSLTHTYIFSGNLVNQVTIGYHRQFSIANPQSAYTLKDIGAMAQEPDNSFPVLIIADTFSAIGGDGQRFQIAQNTFDLGDSLLYTRGKHAFHFGGGVSRVQDNFTKFHFEGIAFFLSFPDFLLGLPAGNLTFPGGVPTFVGGNGTPLSNVVQSQDFAGLTDRAWRVWGGNAFVQDDIKLTSRFTVNLGFRYDRIGGLGDVLGRNSSFDFSKADPNAGCPIPPALPTPGCNSLAGFVVPSNVVLSNFPGGTLPAGVTQIGNNLGINGDGQNTLNPRVGFAWQLPRTNSFVLRGGYGMFHSQLNGQPFLQLITAPPFGLLRNNVNSFLTPPASFAKPFQPIPTSFPVFTPYSPATAQSVTTFGPHYRPSRITRYGLNLQTELAKDFVLEVGYVGARGEHLNRDRSLNQANLASVASPIRGETTNTLANVALRAPLLGFDRASLLQIESAGASWYNALQASLSKRFGHGLQFLASYTFAKDLATDATTSTGPNGGTTLGDQNNPRSRYGQDGFTRPHRFIFSYIYQLPSPQNRKSLMGETLGGWQLSGVTTIQSGHNLTLVATNANNVFGINGQGQDRGSINCPASQLVTQGSVQSKLNNYFNQSCIIATPIFGPDDPKATGFGNSGVGIVRGPDQSNFDLSLTKHFPLPWEGKNVEFRSEFFNAFNHPQFADPTTDVTVKAAAGVISATSVAPRVIQFALKLNF